MKRKASKNLNNSKPKAHKKSNDSDVEAGWPHYFHSLFQVFKALNTVLAFVASKNHLATTFSVIRSSVERLLKRPLLLSDVAELKSLMPDMVRFSYVPRNEIQIHERVNTSAAKKPLDSVDFSLPSSSVLQDDEHVLILDFVDNVKAKKSSNIGFHYTTPQTMTSAAVKKLVERRNKAFIQAVDDLILATSPDDAATLIRQSGQQQVPINPSSIRTVKKVDSAIPPCDDRPPVASVIDEIMDQDWYKGQIVDRRLTEGQSGRTAELNPPLPEAIMKALQQSRNIQEFYSHQVTAIQAIRQGKNVVVSTRTASGKSVIYQVPLLCALLEDRASKAIFVYPTKALAQDQQSSLRQLISCCSGLEEITVSTFDGDTPQEARAGLRESASVIFTNFDMLHASILPHEESWRGFFRNVKLFVVDELHYYSGLMASHIAYVIRRFRRLAAGVGNCEIRFVSCSATITNPLLHMRNLFNIDENEIDLVTEDGSPAGPKEYLIWNPLCNNSMKGESSLSDATKLMKYLMKRGFRVILFCKIRKVCELAMKSLRADLSGEGRYDILERVKPYRGGYLQEERRHIEKEAFSGRLLGIIATNALELGVDIGTLDVVIMLGFPMSIASFRQQAGRAGRRSRDSLSILVADIFAIDQHYTKNPEELYNQAPDDLTMDMDNKIILEAHLQCAAHEMPLSLDDAKHFGIQLQNICKEKLVQDEEGWYHPHPISLPYPQSHISIRGSREEKYAVVLVKRGHTVRAGSIILEEVEDSRAIFELYEGGVFMHQGITYIIQEVNHDARMAKVVQADVNWITSPRDFTDVNAIQTYRIREVTSHSQRTYYGKIKVEVKVFGFYKIRNQQILDTVDLDTPTWERETTGFWIDLPKSILDLMQRKKINAAEAIHAAEHALLNRFGSWRDIKTECKASEKEFRVTPSQRKRPARLIFYDAVGQGGMAVKAFDHVHDLLERADAAIAGCPCLDGCKQCVHSPACKENNEVCSKLGASLIIKSLLGHQIDPQQVPEQSAMHGLNTVVVAQNVPAMDDLIVETDS